MKTIQVSSLVAMRFMLLYQFRNVEVEHASQFSLPTAYNLRVTKSFINFNSKRYTKLVKNQNKIENWICFFHFFNIRIFLFVFLNEYIFSLFLVIEGFSFLYFLSLKTCLFSVSAYVVINFNFDFICPCTEHIGF